MNERLADGFHALVGYADKSLVRLASHWLRAFRRVGMRGCSGEKLPHRFEGAALRAKEWFLNG